MEKKKKKKIKPRDSLVTTTLAIEAQSQLKMNNEIQVGLDVGRWGRKSECFTLPSGRRESDDSRW